jgi:hypothetical protein
MPSATGATRQVEFHCPFCKARNRAELTVEVDAADTDAVEALLDGSLFEAACWHCKETAPFEYSLLYTDAANRRAVWLEPPNDPLALGEAASQQTGEDWTRLRVQDSNTLRELVRIQQAGLDEAAMLLVKHLLAARILQDTGVSPVLCAFDALARDADGEWLEYVLFQTEESEPEMVRAPRSVYDGAAEAAAVGRSEVLNAGEWVDWSGETAGRLWSAAQRNVIPTDY